MCSLPQLIAAVVVALIIGGGAGYAAAPKASPAVADVAAQCPNTTSSKNLPALRPGAHLNLN